MELRQIEVFERVAALRSITRAAEELYLTQPAVSRSISALERELGARLFDRLPRSVALTPAGSVLLDHSRKLIHSAEEAVRAVADVSAGEAGRLAIGASSTAATYVLPEILGRYRVAHPRVEISVQTGGSAHVVELVMKNDVDVGVVMGFAPREDIAEIRLVEFETVVVVAVGHPRSGLESGTPVSEIAREPLIVMQPGANLRNYVNNLYRASGHEPRVSMEMDNVEAIKKMVEVGLGVALLPRLAVEREVDAGRLRAISINDSPIPKRAISLIHRRDRFVFAAMLSFIRQMRKELE